MARLQLTLALLKPDLVARPMAARAVRRAILTEDFVIVRRRQLVCSMEEAGRFYSEHHGRFFFDRLVSYMSSGPVQALVLGRAGAVQHWRHTMGPTRPSLARLTAPHTLRGRFGLSDTRNSLHGSDSEESARREILFFFPGFDAGQCPVVEEESLGLRGSAQ